MKDIKFDLTPEILTLVAELDEFKGRWNATQSLAPDRLLQLKKIATIESVGSSTRIEGVSLSDKEVEALLSGVKTFSFRSRDEQEVAGYAELMDLIFSSHLEMEFSENLIKQLHSVLLKFSNKDQRHRGEYKKLQNSVEAFDTKGKSLGIIFKTTTPFATPKEMTELVEWTKTGLNKKDLHPLLVISMFVVAFLKIHPFQDGNGRLSRALTTLLLLQAKYLYVPFASLERVIEENKDNYYLRLRKAQVGWGEDTKALSQWITFFLKCLHRQKLTLEKKLKSEDLIATLPPLSVQILEALRLHGSLSVSEISRMADANRNTVKSHLQSLLTNLRIQKDGVGKATRYRLR